MAHIDKDGHKRRRAGKEGDFSSSDLETAGELPYQAASLAGSTASYDRHSSGVIDYRHPLSYYLRAHRQKILLFSFAVFVGCLLAACIFFAVVTFDEADKDKSPQPPPDNRSGFLSVNNAAVSTENKICSDIGLTMIQAHGGNAVDAAVASCLCIGVLNSFSSGIGGGGVMM